MKSTIKILLALLVTFTMFAGSASAYSYSDADGDGLCEEEEVISFEGDEYYVDENGNKHYISYWEWDFESDGNIDANGQFVTHIYNQPGTYTVTLNMINADEIIYQFEIVIVCDGDDHDCKFWKHIKKFLHKHPEYKHQVQWLIKKLGILDNKDCGCD